MCSARGRTWANGALCPPSGRTAHRLLLAGSAVAMSLLTSGCVYTRTHVTAPAQVHSARHIDPVSANIPVSASSPPEASGFVELGLVETRACAFNLISSLPTRADADEALRRRAGKLGADAVTGVTYRYERQGLMAAGCLRATGRAMRHNGD